MFKSVSLIIVVALVVFGWWFYSNITTPQADSGVRVNNLPWQITVVDPHTLHVLDLDIGRSTLDDAVNSLLSEYNLAWFDNPDNSISLEAYFIRVSKSGLRAKVVLQLDASGLDTDYLKKNSGKPEIQTSRSIKYPLDDLAHTLKDRKILQLTYIPKINLDQDMITSRFGKPAENIVVDENTEFWLYPDKGLVINWNRKAKEAFHYIPPADFDRVQKSIILAAEQAKAGHDDTAAPSDVK